MTRRAVVLSLSIVGCWGVLSLPAAAGGGCHAAPRPFDARTQMVAMEDYCFSPAVVRIKPKQSITWVNRDHDDHTVTGVGGTWGSYDELGRDARVADSFAAPGVYPYFCALHPGMVGAVVVGDGVSHTGAPPREGHAVSGDDGVISADELAVPGISGDRDQAGSSSSQAGGASWLWAAPVVLAAGVVIGRRRKLA